MGFVVVPAMCCSLVKYLEDGRGITTHVCCLAAWHAVALALALARLFTWEPRWVGQANVL